MVITASAVPGIVQCVSVDQVRHPVRAYLPASGQEFFARLRQACVFHDVVDLREQPVAGDGPVAEDAFGTLEARRLDHPIDTIGYRLVEPDGRHFVPELLAQASKGHARPRAVPPGGRSL